jgi:hypothetical protein
MFIMDEKKALPTRDWNSVGLQNDIGFRIPLVPVWNSRTTLLDKQDFDAKYESVK